MARKVLIVVLALAAVAGVALAVIVAASPTTLIDARTVTAVRTTVQRPPAETVTIVSTDPNQDPSVPNGTQQGAPPPRLGVAVTDLATGCRKVNPSYLPNCGLRVGVVVEDVVSGSPADQAGIRRGDVIVMFNGIEVNSPDGLRSLVEAAGAGASVEVEVSGCRDHWPAGTPYRCGKLMVTVEIAA